MNMWTCASFYALDAYRIYINYACVVCASVATSVTSEGLPFRCAQTQATISRWTILSGEGVVVGGGLMVSVLDFLSRGSGSNPGQGRNLVRDFCFTCAS